MTMTQRQPRPLVWVHEDDAFNEVKRSIGSSYFEDIDPVYDAALASGEVQTRDGQRGKEVHLQDLRKWLKRYEPRTSKAGRPPMYDWEGCLIAMAHNIHDDGLPETNEAICERMRQWFILQIDDHPGDTEIKKRASAIRKEFDR